MNSLAALVTPALLAIIMLTPQSASANWIGGFNCFGEPRCVSGWNYAIIQAQTDWNSGQYTKISNGGNPDCFIGHTQAYCNGYTKGYTYEWNTLYQWQQTPTGSSLDTPRNATKFLEYDNSTYGILKYYDKALAIDPHDVRALTSKGVGLENLGNHPVRNIGILEQ